MYPLTEKNGMLKGCLFPLGTHTIEQGPENYPIVILHTYKSDNYWRNCSKMKFSKKIALMTARGVRLRRARGARCSTHSYFIWGGLGGVGLKGVLRGCFLPTHPPHSTLNGIALTNNFKT